jgi:hypothetical protein
MITPGHVRALVAVLSVGAICCAVRPAHGIGNHAGIAFPTYSGGSGDFAPYTIGWQFDVTSSGGPINVTHLGYYNYVGGSLNTSHDVAIFYGPGFGILEATVVPGASATVAAGTGEHLGGSSPAGYFRYHDIADVVLVPGTYRIGGVGGGGDPAQVSPVSLMLGPGIANVTGYYKLNSGSGPEYPVSLGDGPPYSGPNFLFPEPTSGMLLAIVGAVILRRRRARVRVRVRV